MIERSLLDKVLLPYSFTWPFALFFSDGDMALLWASSEKDKTRWTQALSKLIPKSELA